VDGALDRKYTYTYSGIGVNVYIFDTGIMSIHDEFTEINVTCGINVVANETCDDFKGHGTHIAGIVGGKTYGLAKNVNIINVKVLDKNGNGNVDKVIKGLEYVLEQKLLLPNTPMIIGLSLGGNYSTSFNDAINRCVDAGIIVVVAAGNEGVDACTTSPSSADKGVAVGAMDVTFIRPSWSNFGPCVNIFAPAVAILSATYDARDKKKTLYRTGTSMAVPHVVGVIAMYLEWNSSLTPSEVYGFLVKDSVSGLLSNLGIDDDNVLISSTKIQQYDPISVPTAAPTLAPSSVSLETPSCGAILTPCTTNEDCCYGCLNVNLLNLNLFGKRCFLWGNN
jgi:subtilisin family serine protease